MYPMSVSPTYKNRNLNSFQQYREIGLIPCSWSDPMILEFRSLPILGPEVGKFTGITIWKFGNFLQEVWKFVEKFGKILVTARYGFQRSNLFSTMTEVCNIEILNITDTRLLDKDMTQHAVVYHLGNPILVLHCHREFHSDTFTNSNYELYLEHIFGTQFKHILFEILIYRLFIQSLCGRILPNF